MLLSKLNNFILPFLTRINLVFIKDDPKNVEYFLANCLPKDFDELFLMSGDYSSPVYPPIDNYVKSLGIVFYLVLLL